MNDPWKILRISPTRDVDKIKAAYRIRVQKIHPDKARTLEGKKRNTLHFTELQAAYAQAKLMARYAPDVQLLHIRYPPNPSENAFLSNGWLMVTMVLVAGLFGFWLIWVSAMPHHIVHTLSATHGLFLFWYGFARKHPVAGVDRDF